MSSDDEYMLTVEARKFKAVNGAHLPKARHPARPPTGVPASPDPDAPAA